MLPVTELPERVHWRKTASLGPWARRLLGQVEPPCRSQMPALTPPATTSTATIASSFPTGIVRRGLSSSIGCLRPWRDPVLLRRLERTTGQSKEAKLRPLDFRGDEPRRDLRPAMTLQRDVRKRRPCPRRYGEIRGSRHSGRKARWVQTRFREPPRQGRSPVAGRVRLARSIPSPRSRAGRCRPSSRGDRRRSHRNTLIGAAERRSRTIEQVISGKARIASSCAGR
jgi:hypothetical protein